MGIAYHNIYAVDGAGLNDAFRIYHGTVTAVYPSAGAGIASTVVVTWTEPIPLPYTAVLSPIEDCTYFFNARTALGCTLNVLPRLAANALAGGSVEIMISS